MAGDPLKRQPVGFSFHSILVLKGIEDRFWREEKSRSALPQVLYDLQAQDPTSLPKHPLKTDLT